MEKINKFKDWYYHRRKNISKDTLEEIETLKLDERLKETFPKLVFNEELHRYSVEGKPLTSVSTTISQYVEPFDTVGVANSIAENRSYWDKGFTAETLISEWDIIRDEACDKGHRVHTFGENFPVKKGDPLDNFEQSVINFWDSLPEHVVPVGFELQMYCVEQGIAGTSDILLYNTKSKKFIIADYKTNKDLFKNYMGKTMLHPFTHLLDCPLSKYCLQLSYYQYLFELTGFQVERRVIIWLKPDGSFQMYDTDDVRNLIITPF